MTVTNMPRRPEWLSSMKGPNQAASTLAEVCERDIYVREPAGNVIKSSWLESGRAKKALMVVRHLQSECGDSIARSIHGMSFNRDESACDVHLDWDDFEYSGAEIPDESPVLIRCGKSTCLVTATLRRCEA